MQGRHGGDRGRRGGPAAAAAAARYWFPLVAHVNIGVFRGATGRRTKGGGKQRNQQKEGAKVGEKGRQGKRGWEGQQKQTQKQKQEVEEEEEEEQQQEERL